MAVDLQFTDANITNYQDIPAGVYPILPSTSITDVVVSKLGSQVLNNILPDTTNIYVDWKYPASDDLYTRVAVGYQLQVIEGTFGQAEAQNVLPPGNLVFEHIVDQKYEAEHYIGLSNGAAGVLLIPSTTMRQGVKYTVRVRSLVFSELGDGTIDDQYFKYTQWGISNFRVNTVPAATNLRTNGETNPQRLPRNTKVSFTFTFADPDGPAYLYRAQVSQVPAVWANPLWDSGVVSAGTALGNRDFSLAYGGPALAPNTPYCWRIWVSDSVSDGGWTLGADAFQLNQLPTVTSLKANGEELVYGDIPVVPATGTVLAWTFNDIEGDIQTAYNLKVSQIRDEADGGVFEVLNTGNVFSAASAIALPDLADGGTFEVSLQVRDSVEFGDPVIGTFTSNARPQVLDLRVDGRENPGDVPTPVPVISWKFFDSTPGDIQEAYRIQVATNDTFATLLWDTGTISSSVTSVTYAGQALTHGSYYYIRVAVSDGVSFSSYANGFFSVNRAPNSPSIITPGAGSYSGDVNVTWTPASPLDPDGDDVTYTIELTPRRSSNQGWEYLAGPFKAVTPDLPKTEYVVIVVMDGVRVSESLGTPANIPNILALGGSIATSFYADTPATVTINGHDAIMTGHYENIANDGSQSPTEPSLMAEWLYERGLVSNGTVGYSDRVKLITSKDKLWCLRTVAAGGIWDDYIPYANCGVNGIGGGGYRSDAATHTIFKAQCLGATPPVISFVSYAETDTAAHAGNWAAYIAAIQQTDVYVGEIWSLIQAHPLMADKTMLIVTNDHGREADPNWQNHGNVSEPERHVMFVAAGPRVKENFTTGTYYGLKDIAQTALGMMGMGKTYGEGVFMTDIALPQVSTTSFVFDTSNVKAGNDYGIRVIANDGYADSDPAAGTSSINVNGLGFTILNHNPTSPIFVYPKSIDLISSLLKVEWVEADPVDVDGDSVFYVLEMTRDASVATPTYEKLGVFNEGVVRTFIDVSNLPDGVNYRLRITAQDDKGGVGTISYSDTFTILNTTAITDFETLGPSLYLSTTDGRVFKATSSVWQVDEEFVSRDDMVPFEEFSRGVPAVEFKDGKLSIRSAPGSTYMLRIG